MAQLYDVNMNLVYASSEEEAKQKYLELGENNEIFACNPYHLLSSDYEFYLDTEFPKNTDLAEVLIKMGYSEKYYRHYDNDFKYNQHYAELYEDLYGENFKIKSDICIRKCIKVNLKDIEKYLINPSIVSIYFVQSLAFLEALAIDLNLMKNDVFTLYPKGKGWAIN